MVGRPKAPIVKRTEPGFDHWRPHFYRNEGTYKLGQPDIGPKLRKLKEHAIHTSDLVTVGLLVETGFHVRMSDPASHKPETNLISPDHREVLWPA